MLAQVKDERYRQFYRSRRDAGDTIILDNGAYELGGSINRDEFADAVRFYNPQFIVCPDVMHADWGQTYARTKDFLDRYYDEFSLNSSFIGVPQTTDGRIIEWIEGMLRMTDELPIDGIGLPRALVTHYHIDPLTRVTACEFIKKRYRGMYVHAFGMVKGNVDELNMLRNAGCDSIDSSAPVWRAWTKGLSLTHLDHHRVWDEIGTECDFNHNVDGWKQIGWEEKHKQILSNLEACGVNINPIR